MLTKRIIPCLDVRDGQTVKGVHFVDIRYAGDPVDLAQSYVERGADELVFLDITATMENRSAVILVVKNIAARINIPFTVGGGISCESDVHSLLNAGADKISINTAAVHNPKIITRLSQKFGSQCIVLAIDTNFDGNDWMVCTHGGRKQTPLKTTDWARQGVNLGAGEILLTSMNHDGCTQGFALDITRRISESVPVPVIASGGAGAADHFVDVFTEGKADAALAASVFHFETLRIPELKQYLKNKGIPVRL